MKLNLMTWFDARECKYLPKHFVPAGTELTEESKDWVLETLIGRFHIKDEGNPNNLFDNKLVIYFEDPKELVLYELRWS